ncbi:glycosyltransferase family 2 protein [uncultured Bacteroides sp.]|uniref:glycosyltransferase family 2 protein n=1 Tax=uncultured Bacteroides sp. TaxID=162156 RepID=UPI002617698F|nr:glycosyltransferase family 2 protein [uncultured Bacteroides sp.]
MKVSIIIPVYNVSDYIKECIESVVIQHGNIECIIVNDCTQDDSIFILREYLKNYSGNVDFKIVEHSMNRGLSTARNTGINTATGDYLFFLDSDDRLAEGAIEKMVSYLQSDEPPYCVIGDYATFGVCSLTLPKNNISINSLSNNDEVLNSYLQCQWFPMAWNKLILRDFVLEHTLYFKEGMLHEDELWSYQLALKLPSLQFCHELTYLYRIRDNSITKKKSIENFRDNLMYCDYISKNVSSGSERQTYIFLQNRLNVVLLEMFQNKYSIDEIWNVATHIKKQFGIHWFLSLKFRNLVNIIRSILLYSDKHILEFYLRMIKSR